MTVNVGGIISIVIFYLIILLVGIWASRKRSNGKASETEEVMLAGRNIGIFVGIFTMTGEIK
jgi:high affinity choline transporter 7